MALTKAEAARVNGQKGGRPRGRWLGQWKTPRVPPPIDPLGTMPQRMQECEVRERFRILNEFHNWFRVEVSIGAYPDMLLRAPGGQAVRVEVEVESRSFIAHEHDVDGCDLIVCWRHNWPDCPIPVLVLEWEWTNYQQMKAAIRRSMFHVEQESREKTGT